MNFFELYIDNCGENKAGDIRDSVNGVNKYARIPIRRKRTPILAEEFIQMAARKFDERLSNEDIVKEALSLCEKEKYEEAGKWFTFLDFLGFITCEIQETN